MSLNLQLMVLGPLMLAVFNLANSRRRFTAVCLQHSWAEETNLNRKLMLLGPVPLLKWRPWTAQRRLLRAKRQAFVQVLIPKAFNAHPLCAI